MHGRNEIIQLTDSPSSRGRHIHLVMDLDLHAVRSRLYRVHTIYCAGVALIIMS